MVIPRRTKYTRMPCETCGKIVSQGRCPEHPKSKKRRSPGQRAHTEAMRAAGNPLMCAYCELRVATATDHVVPRAVLDVDLLEHFGILSLDDPRNLLASCQHCNTSKGGRRLMTWVLSVDMLEHFGILSLDDPRNLLASCQHCNTSKGGRRLMTWVLSGRAPSHASELMRQRIAAGLPH